MQGQVLIAVDAGFNGSHPVDQRQACISAPENESVSDCAFNVESGKSKTILDTAAVPSKPFSKNRILPKITGTNRVGDIRQSFADIGIATSVLGYQFRNKLGLRVFLPVCGSLVI